MRLLDSAAEMASAERLREWQRHRLKQFLNDVVSPNPFYARKYAEAGISEQDIRDPDAFASLPMLDKDEVVADIRDHPPFGSRSIVPPGALRQVVETSGTSGRGRERFPLTEADVEGTLALERFGFYWAGVAQGSVVVSCLPLTTRAGGQWYHDTVRSLGATYLAVGSFDTPEKLRHLADYDVTLFVANSPSYLKRLEVVAQEEGVDLHSLGVGSILVAGEPFSEEWLSQREQAWGSRIFEQYGSTQRAIAWTCERGAVPDGRRGVLHTFPHLAVYDVVDPTTGREVPDGEVGELVITPFSACESSPLVRFATGDRVVKVPEGGCPCGRALPGFEAGSIERFDNVLRVRGVNFSSLDADEVVLNSGAREYQARLYLDERTGREEIEIAAELAPHCPDTAGTLDSIAGRLHERFGLRFNVVTHVGPSLLERGEGDGAKRKRWSDQRETRAEVPKQR